ncbi:YjbF family lipoprotein [Shewanella sp. SR43-4]|uniref:YjbF family lipoprotein n=1 Tax=Shewanella sp. SR43-4 TaxID=2760942 RepID=UPI0015FBDCA6|nr:YjbF family lipoprotein [Shewanella sp. SR43-4]MBB1318544.1 YjbF family lipoprotein [Shewanella sp. SR43-4]
MSFILNSKTLFIISLITLSGCSNTSSQIANMVKESIIGPPDSVISASKIESSPYASIYVRVNKSSQAYVLLAFAEASQTIPATPFSKKNAELKWVSSDAAMLVTRNGRLLKTVNLFDGNLVTLSSEQIDPISLGLHLTSTPMQWQSTIDWQPGYHFSYKQQSTFTFIADETVIINESPVILKRYDEHVFIPKLGIEYNNQFWIDATSGMVFKSNQKIAPNLPYIDITLLKPYTFEDIK